MMSEEYKLMKSCLIKWEGFGQWLVVDIFFPQKIRCAEFLCASFCKPLSGDPSVKILKLSSSSRVE